MPPDLTDAMTQGLGTVPLWRRVVRYSKALFTPLALMFLGLAVWSDWAFLNETVRQSHLTYLYICHICVGPLACTGAHTGACFV